MPKKTFIRPLINFKGVNELITPGINAPYTGDSQDIGGVTIPFTRDARNVWFRDGQVHDRDGVVKLGGSSAADSAIDGLFPYTLIGDTRYLIRITTTAVAQYNETSNVWTNITGTALTGTSNTLVDATVIDDTFIFTNGKDKPRKWAGTGNTAVIASDGASVWGKTVVAFQGFLMFGNWSSDGTTFDKGIEIIYADDWDTAASWEPCNTNIIVVAETPGEILKMGVLDRSLMVYKRDGVVKLTFNPGSSSFRHELMPFDMGILAPNSLVTINRVGHIFMARDKQLYLNDGQTIRPVPRHVAEELRIRTIDAYVKFSCAANDYTKTTYTLLYPKTAASTWLDGRIDYNYVSGEFSKGDYQEAVRKFHRLAAFDFTDASTVRSTLVATDDNKLVYRLDSGQNDETTVPTRYYTSDWTNLGFVGDKYLRGGVFVFNRIPGGRVRISVAQDYQEQFRYAQTFSLSGLDVTSDDVVIRYELTSLLGNEFNFKLEFFRDVSTAANVFKSAYLRFTPLSEDTRELQPMAQTRSA